LQFFNVKNKSSVAQLSAWNQTSGVKLERIQRNGRESWLKTPNLKTKGRKHEVFVDVFVKTGKKKSRWEREMAMCL
jgi:hypothetical protein